MSKYAWVALGSFVFVALAGLLFVYRFSSSKNQSDVLPYLPIASTTVSTFKNNVIGKSVNGRNIEAFTYGSGDTLLLFVGGMHGGYEWNSILLAYEFIDYLGKNPDMIPKGLKLTVIPDANPDGAYAIIRKDGRFDIGDIPEGLDQSAGRLNANGVDLNRNFDCKWEPTAVWRNKKVSGGTEPFSEPESVAIRDFVLTQRPRAVVTWHSQANAVYASECKNGVLPETLAIMKAYSDASGYPAVKSFNAYPVTGDTEGWLASIGIAALTVEMKSHESVEWEKNLAGIKALIRYYSPRTDN